MTEIKTTKIPRRQKCVDKDHPYTGGARDIYDDVKEKSQEQVNKDVDDTFALHQSEINALDSQNYYTVEATQADTTIGSVMSRAGVIPQINTLYRVGKWDGTQYDATVYSEYAYNIIGESGEWKLLDVKSYGIDDEPTDGSNNLVKSSGVANSLKDKLYLKNIIEKGGAIESGVLNIVMSNADINANGVVVQHSSTYYFTLFGGLAVNKGDYFYVSNSVSSSLFEVAVFSKDRENISENDVALELIYRNQSASNIEDMLITINNDGYLYFVSPNSTRTSTTLNSFKLNEEVDDLSFLTNEKVKTVSLVNDQINTQQSGIVLPTIGSVIYSTSGDIVKTIGTIKTSEAQSRYEIKGNLVVGKTYYLRVVTPAALNESEITIRIKDSNSTNPSTVILTLANHILGENVNKTIFTFVPTEENVESLKWLDFWATNVSDEVNVDIYLYDDSGQRYINEKNDEFKTGQVFYNELSSLLIGNVFQNNGIKVSGAAINSSNKIVTTSNFNVFGGTKVIKGDVFYISKAVESSRELVVAVVNDSLDNIVLNYTIDSSSIVYRGISFGGIKKFVAPNDGYIICSSYASVRNQLTFNHERKIDRYANITKPIISVAHQGYAGESGYGGSRVGMYKNASKYGFTYGECDVQWTSDNIPIGSHDASFDYEGQTIVIAEHTYAELLTYRNFSKIEDIIKECKENGIGLVIDKCSYTWTTDQRQIIFGLVKKYRMQDNVVWFWIYDISNSFITQLFSFYGASKIVVPSSTSVADVNSVLTDKNTIYLGFSSPTVETIVNTMASHDARVKCSIYTIDTIADYKDYIPYVDMITSNRVSFPMIASY